MNRRSCGWVCVLSLLFVLLLLIALLVTSADARSSLSRFEAPAAFDGTDYGTAVLLQPDGKLVAARHLGGNFALARYNGDRFGFLPLLVRQ